MILDPVISGESSCPVGQVECDIWLPYHHSLELLLVPGKPATVNVEPCLYMNKKKIYIDGHNAKPCMRQIFNFEII